MYKRLEFDKYKKYVKYEERLDKKSNCKYVFTTIKRNIKSNERIFPRVRTTYNNDVSTSLYDYMSKEEVLFAINAGIFNTQTGKPECLLINNRKIIVDQKETYIHTSPKDGGEKRDELFILGIDDSGDLLIYDPKTKAEDIINDGCIDAIMGFVPLIVNYKKTDLDYICSYISYDKHPRQIIGENDEGDYFILTILKPGMTLDEARNLLIRLNVKLAYNLDGGSSTQTFFHKNGLTPPYRGNTGRKIPTIITFEVITGKMEIH